ncbi:hypothetical protein ACHWQZ_G002919 [Mnemiopsis leidyi]
MYALENRKKYEKKEGKQLSFNKLLELASTDWANQPEDVKKHYKTLAKNDNSSTVTPRHETSCQRMDTEAAVVTNKLLGEKWEVKKSKKIRKSCRLFQQSLGSIEDLINRQFGIIDFNAHVDYMDGLTVPAEFALVQGSIKNGLNLTGTTSPCNELFLIEPENKRHLRNGFRNEIKLNCELEHGINIYDLKNKGFAVDIEIVIEKITELIPDEMLLLCRKEDVNRVLGAWYWIKYQLEYKLPKIQVITLEYFAETIINHLIKKHNRGEFGDKISEHTLTDHFSKPFRDTNPLLRCPFHNTDEGCDKKSCTEKNTKKYFYQLITVLADFLPEVDLGRTPNTHIFVPQEENSKRKADRNIQNIPAPTNTPREHPGNPSLDIQPEPTPRPPHSYSARNKSLNKSCCTSSSNSTRSSSPVNNTFEDQLPRRPKPEKKNLANGYPVVKSKSSVTYDKDSLTYDTSNGASAVESSANCENQFSELPLSGRQSRSGRGRSRARTNTPSPPGVTVGSVSVTPPSVGSGHPALGSASGKFASRGRGERMAAMLVSTRKTENVSAPDCGDFRQ